MMIHNKYKFNYLHIPFEEFSVNRFQSEIVKNFKLNTTYSLLLKISSHSNFIFKMCGPQIGLKINHEHDLEYYSHLYHLMMTRIESTIDNYNYLDRVESIEIMYSLIIPQKELTLKNIYKYPINQPLISKKEVYKNFNQNLLPLTTDTSYYGYPLLLEDREKMIVTIKGQLSFNKDEKDMIINNEDKLFIHHSSKHKCIILSKQLDDKNFVRYIFDYDTAILIIKMKDVIFNKDTMNSFLRTIGNMTLRIEDQKVLYYKVNNSLQPIKPLMNKYRDRNINISTFDLETFKDNDGLSKVYALGFYTSTMDKPQLYYLKDYSNLDSHQLILKCIDDMLTNKYHNNIFYVHNLAHYDIVFLYNVLLKSNLDKGFDYYMLSTTMRDHSIIKLDIKIKIYSKTKDRQYRYIKISLVDSLNLLNFSLDKLTKEFNIELRKSHFPHRFVNRNNLNYIGHKPSMDYYDHMTLLEYQNISEDHWDLKYECLHYLEKDLKGLFEVMNEFSRLLYIHFNVELTEALTMTRLALNIFKQNYYKQPSIPSINKIFLFNFIKEGYFGGITEVYKPYGKDLYYIDVNSLYPYAALNPMPGCDCHYIESFEDKGLELNELFGFFYARVITNNLYIGLLPVYKNNQIIYPNGEFEGIWSSEELKFAQSKGYKITVMKGYQFNKVDKIFDSYIHDLFTLKKDSNGFLKLIYKSLLNNLLGRFGLSVIKPITQTLSREKRDYMMTTRIVYSHTILNDHKFLVTYNPIISKEICREHGLDYFKVLENESVKNIENNLDVFKDVSIATAAFVTSYARIFINKCKLEILEKGGSIYYSDTDSIVIDKSSLNYEWIGDNIGQFKLEYDIKEAYFLSNKTYCLILNNGETIIKTKGVINNSLNVEHFKSMYFENKNVTAIKNNTISNYELAYVNIEKKEVTLNYNSFTKRDKIYNNNGLWINTKPLNIFKE